MRIPVGVLFQALAVLWSAGSAAAHDGLHEQIAALTREIEATPADARLYLRRAELFRLHRQPGSALADLERARALDPALEGARLCGARLYLDAGQLDAARSLVEGHLALHPDDPDALLVRARLAGRCRAVDDAVRDYDRALALFDPPEPDHCLERAELLLSLGHAGVDRALAGIDAALARLGPVAALELRAVEIEVERGRIDDGLARLDALAARAPRPERWLAQRGEILLAAGRAREALDAFGSARVALESTSRRLSSAADRELASLLDCRMAEVGSRLAGGQRGRTP